MYIDDAAPKNPAPYMDFQRRYVQGLPQLDPVLDTFVETFASLYDIYEPFIANFVISSALEFVTVCSVEHTIRPFTPISRPVRFPWFLRSRAGANIVFGLLAFPRSGNHDVSACLRALPDIEYSVAGTNDLLSYVVTFPLCGGITMNDIRFYKEQLADESETYVHRRANIEGKTLLQTLSEIKTEIIHANENVLDILTRFGNEATVKAWQQWEYGYMYVTYVISPYESNKC